MPRSGSWSGICSSGSGDIRSLDARSGCRCRNERLISELEARDALPRMTPEQRSLAELITVLVEQFERRYDLGHAEPLDGLKSLMEDRGVRQRDLIPIFGSSSVASDVLRGKRGISKQHARGLAEYFSVPVSLFYLAPDYWVFPRFFTRGGIRPFRRKPSKSRNLSW